MGTFHFPWIFIIKRNKKKMANKQEIIPVTFKADNIFDISDNAATLAYQKSSAYTDNQVSAVDSRVTTLNASVSDISSTVSSLKTTVNNNSSEIKTIKGDVSTLQQNEKAISATVKSHTTTLDDYGTRITDVEDSTSDLTIKADSIESKVSRLKTSAGNNLFSFKNANFENVTPYIQGYGFIVPTGNTYSRVSNLQANGKTGDYVVSFDIYGWGEDSSLKFQLCDVNPTNGNSFNALGGQWKHYDLYFTIPENNTYVNRTSWNGFFDVEGNTKNLAIRNFQVIRGNISADFAYSQDDLDDVDINGSQIFEITANSQSSSSTVVETTDTIDSTDITYTVYQIPYTGSKTYYNPIQSSSPRQLTVNKSYTLTFYAKSSVANTIASVYLYPSLLKALSYDFLSLPSVAGEQSSGSRNDGQTVIQLDTTWRKFIIHFYNQSSSNLNLIIGRLENQTSCTLSVGGIDFEEGFIVDDYESSKSVIRQTSDNITANITNGLRNTGININDGKIQLNANNIELNSEFGGWHIDGDKFVSDKGLTSEYTQTAYGNSDFNPNVSLDGGSGQIVVNSNNSSYGNLLMGNMEFSNNQTTQYNKSYNGEIRSKSVFGTGNSFTKTETYTIPLGSLNSRSESFYDLAVRIRTFLCIDWGVYQYVAKRGNYYVDDYRDTVSFLTRTKVNIKQVKDSTTTDVCTLNFHHNIYNSLVPNRQYKEAIYAANNTTLLANTGVRHQSNRGDVYYEDIGSSYSTSWGSVDSMNCLNQRVFQNYWTYMTESDKITVRQTEDGQKINEILFNLNQITSSTGNISLIITVENTYMTPWNRDASNTGDWSADSKEYYSNNNDFTLSDHYQKYAYQTLTCNYSYSSSNKLQSFVTPKGINYNYGTNDSFTIDKSSMTYRNNANGIVSNTSGNYIYKSNIMSSMFTLNVEDYSAASNQGKTFTATSKTDFVYLYSNYLELPSTGIPDGKAIFVKITGGNSGVRGNIIRWNTTIANDAGTDVNAPFLYIWCKSKSAWIELYMGN